MHHCRSDQHFITEAFVDDGLAVLPGCMRPVAGGTIAECLVEAGVEVIFCWGTRIETTQRTCSGA